MKPISDTTLSLLLRLPPRERFFRWGREFAYPSLLERDRQAHFDRTLWENLAVLGLFDPKIGLRDQVEAFIGLAEGSMDIPFALSAIAHGAVATELLHRFGTEEQKSTFLPDMVSGKTIAAVCNSEETGGTDVKSIVSRLEPSPQGSVETATLHLNKRGATNLTLADVVFTSVWRLPTPQAKDTRPTLEVLLLAAKNLVQESHVPHLAGFKTGLTGSLRTKDPLEVSLRESLLGGEKAGFKILKHCFNIERLFVSAILIGILDGLLRQSMEFMESRKSFGKPLSEYQYIQEKIIGIYAKREELFSLVERILSSKQDLTKEDLAESSSLLSLLKMTAVEGTFEAATLFYELCGYAAYRVDHVGQKIVRDVMALKMLGGTKEQQKIVLFQELLAAYRAQKEKSYEKKSA